MVLPRDSIPIFSASIPFELLHRNQEIEKWSKATESTVQPFSHASCLAYACAMYRGVAEGIINGRHFDHIADWQTKLEFCAKFRGT